MTVGALIVLKNRVRIVRRPVIACPYYPVLVCLHSEGIKLLDEIVLTLIGCQQNRNFVLPYSCAGHGRVKRSRTSYGILQLR